jgi:nucleotide-binding universal stress UspA family protein
MASRNILVPVDLDDESTWRKPLSTAVEYAGWAEAKVHVMTVVPNEMIRMTVVAQIIPEDFEEKLRNDAKQRLATAIKKCVSDECDVQQIVHLGKIPHEILETARDIEADLIVMAAHKPKLRDFVTGSTTDQVVNRAPCSVWIIRE